MSERLTRFFASRRGIVLAGAVIGVLAPLLQKAGNPPNMGICVACFERDIAGALGLHRAAVVQYIRREIIAFVLGATIAAFLFREFKPRVGSAPIVRFVLGMFAMIGSLAFLGCPWRTLLRLAGGDLNAILGLAGLATGVTIGVQFLKAGYNLALRGLLRPGDHVITSSMEHNSVMRPLRALERQGVEVTVVRCSPEGFLAPADVEAAVQPNTVMIALNHASNVAGTLLPVAEVGHIARRHGPLLLVDAAQTGGAYPIDVEVDSIDLLGFTGHKSLYGPMGTGGLIVGERVDVDQLEPLKRGGTGSRSEHEEQPDFLPDLCESGTPNAVGLAGLEAGVRWVLERGVDAIRAHEVELAQRLIDGLTNIPGVTVYGGLDAELQTATVSFNITGMEPSEVGLRLDEEYGILCRVGLHCAPAAHRTMGTLPVGTVRFGLGAFNTLQEVNDALTAVQALALESR